MLKDVPPPAANCDSASVDRNVEFGKKNRITGTPTLFFTDGARFPGAVQLSDIEKKFASLK
jgi:thiol:disulfide interchange protein DsbC